MRKRKTLDQLTLMDDYMFYQVMKDPGRMKRVLEWILHVTITRLKYVVAQKAEREGCARYEKLKKSYVVFSATMPFK